MCVFIIYKSFNCVFAVTEQHKPECPAAAASAATVTAAAADPADPADAAAHGRAHHRRQPAGPDTGPH